MKRIATAFGVVAMAAVAFGAQPASATSSYDPNVARIANPANVCKAIPGSVQNAAAIFGVTVDLSSFNYSQCVQTLAKGDAVVEPVDIFGDPYANCDELTAKGFITYPETLHAGKSFEDQLLPDLTVKNRKQCGSALYAFHTIFTYLPAGP